MAVNKVDEKELLKVKDELAKLQKALAIVESDKQEAEDALLELSQHLTAQEESLELLQANSNSTAASTMSSDSELDSLYARLKKSELEVEGLSEQLLAKDLSMSQLFTEIGDLKDLLEHYQSIESNQNQESSRQSEEFQSQLSQLQKQLSAMEQQGEEYQKLSDSDKAAMAKLLTEKGQAEELVQQYKNDLERATESLSEQQKQLDEHIDLTNNQLLTTAEINKQLASLKQENEHKTFELDTLQAELDGYKNDIEKQADVIADTQMVNVSLSERLEHLEHNLETETQLATGYKLQFKSAEALNAELTLKLETFNTLQTELDSAQLKVSQLERRNAELIQAQVKQEQSVDQSILELENKVTSLNALIDDEANKHKSEIAFLREQLDSDNLSLKAANEENEKLEELFASSQAELKLSEGRALELTNKVSHLDDGNQTAIEALHKAESELAQTKAGLAKTESELEQVKGESVKTESELTKTKAELVTTLEQLQQATSGFDVSQSEMASLKHEHVELKAKAATSEGKLSKTEAELGKAEAKLSETETELSKLERELGTAKDNAAELALKLEQTEKASVALKAKAAASEGKLSETEAELGKAEAKLSETETELGKLERELGTAKDNAAELAQGQQLKIEELCAKETKLQEQLKLASESESEQVTMLKDDAAKQKQKVDASESRISELTAKLEQVESHQQTQTNQLLSDIESTQAELALANDLVVQGKQKVSRLESELHHYKNAVDEKEQIISTLSRTDEAAILLEKNNLALTNELQNIGEAKQELQRQLDYAEQKAASLQAQLSTSQSVSTEQSDQLLETNIEFNDLIEQLKVENAQYRNDYEKLKVRLDDSLEQLAQVDDDLIKDQHRMLELADELRKEKEQRHQFEHELNLVNDLEQKHRDELESYKQGHIEESELVAEAEVNHARTVIQQLRAENSRLKLDLDEKISDLESQVTEYRLKFNFAQQQLVEQQQLSDEQT